MVSVLGENETPHDYRIKLEAPELELFRRQNVQTILEVCSGDGRNLIALNKMGYHATGIESQPDSVKKTGELIKVNNLDIMVILHPIYYKKFPFNNDSYDCVYSYQYLTHNFVDEIKKVFKEIHRVLKKGGLFSIKISDIEQFNLKHIKGKIYEECDPEFPQIRYRKLAKQTFAKLEQDEIWIPHYGFYMDELKDMLIKTGFDVISIRKIRWNIVGNFTKR